MPKSSTRNVLLIVLRPKNEKQRKIDESLLKEEREPIKNRSKRIMVRMVRGEKPRRKHGRHFHRKTKYADMNAFWNAN